MNSSSISRRGFVAACAVAPIAAACARMTYVSATLDGPRLIVSRAEVDATGFALVESPALAFPVYIHRHAPDRYTAVLTRCMHRGCTVEPSAAKLVCPCHGSEYTHEGAILRGPTELPLIQFPVTVEADRLVILPQSGGPA